MEELALFAQISLFAVWSIKGVECGCSLAAVTASRGEGGVRGLGLYMAFLVGLQYTGTLPTVHRYVLSMNPSLPCSVV